MVLKGAQLDLEASQSLPCGSRGVRCAAQRSKFSGPPGLPLAAKEHLALIFCNPAQGFSFYTTPAQAELADHLLFLSAPERFA